MAKFEGKTGGGGLSAQNSNFGWLLIGSPPDGDSPDNVNINQVKVSPQSDLLEGLDQDSSVDFDLRAFWSLEHMGILDCPTNDPNIHASFEEKINRKADGRYVVEYPWKSGKIRLPTYRNMAEKRMRHQLSKL